MKVVIVGEFSETSTRLIKEIFPEDWSIAIGKLEELNAELVDAEVIIPEHVLIDAAFLERLKHLKLVQTGAGFDNVDIDACTQRGVYAANASGVNAVAVAEHVFAFILCWYKNLIYLDGLMKDGAYRVDYSGAELTNKVIGIIGLGNIGRQVAHLAHAFKMKVLGYDIRSVDFEGAVEFTDFTTLLKKSDIVSLHVLFNAKTRHMIGRAELALMKRDAFLINTSRGPIVDEAALIEALQSHKIGGAGLDVFETEPLPEDSLLRKLNNVILTPHTAGRPDALKFHKHRYEFFIENIRRVSEGKAPIHALNQF
jgi:D-3-phosphoglycerate dehydrogenase